MVRRKEQQRRDRRRLRNAEESLHSLDCLEHLGLVPGAGIVLGTSVKPQFVILSVQPSCVKVRLPDGRKGTMDAVNLINLVAAEGGHVVPARQDNPSPALSLLETGRWQEN
jgi:hypothetical protein